MNNNYSPIPKKIKEQKKSPTIKALEAVSELRGTGRDEIPTDTMGSYTGTSYDNDIPEQDADDL